MFPFDDVIMTSKKLIDGGYDMHLFPFHMRGPGRRVRNSQGPELQNVFNQFGNSVYIDIDISYCVFIQRP